MKYTYPAIITPREGLYAVEFPDIEECVTCADTFPEAIFMAEDALALTLYGYEKTGKAIPPATQSVHAPDGSVGTWIACDTFEYQKRNNNKAVKKTLTIPEWLNEAAIAREINFSQVLQDGLKAQLGI